MELEKSFGTAGGPGNTGDVKTFQDKLLAWLYDHVAGRMLLRPLVSPWFSVLGGRVLESRASALAVKPFAKRNHISLKGCEKQKFDSFNDFFTRKMKSYMRPVCREKDVLVSPCDARLSIYPIKKDSTFLIKNTEYTLEELLGGQAGAASEKIASHFEGGTLWMFRLCVDDYHRYIYPVDARKSENIQIPGIFHTVNPVANDHYPIYKENTREYCLMKTDRAGTLAMMEVGALLVGRIENHHPECRKVRCGDEKGYFAFGGSTIILLSQEGKIVPEDRFLKGSGTGKEIKIKMGEKTGHFCQDVL